VAVKSFLILTFSVAGVVLAANTARADDVRVIVGFKGDASSALVTDHGGQVHRMSGRVVSASIPAKELAKLRSDAGVAYVEEDAIAEALGKVEPSRKPSGGGGGTTSTPPAESVPWGVLTVNADDAWTTNTGADIKVAVIDTGVDLDHPDLQANVRPGVDYVQNDGNPDDDNGHGSHVAGTIAAVKGNGIFFVGVAPDAEIYPVKVLDRRGSGWLSDVAAGIDWAAANGMNIGNMSLGASSSATTLQDACDAAEAAGVLLVAAAGNSGDGKTSTTETSYPAAYDSVVAVGATTSTDGLASFSNTGPYLEISAPGVNIPSTYKNGGSATLSGTSMASPHGAGMAALIWKSLASPSAASVRAALHTKIQDLGTSGFDNGFGYGRIDWLK
jgi:subtilisin